MKIIKFPGDTSAIYTFPLQVIGLLPLSSAKIPKTRSKHGSKAHIASGLWFLSDTSIVNEDLALFIPGILEFS